MAILLRTRGKSHCRRLVSGCVVLAAALAMSVSAAAAEAPGAGLSTYQRGDGQTFYALSLTPPADLATDQPREVVILFDTSASQTGTYREMALAALEASIAGLRPQDRVQLLAVDLAGRPLTNQFVAANSDELRAALAALRRESPLGSTDMEAVLREAITRFDPSRPAGRSLLYIGDGVSNANLLGTDSFRALVQGLSESRIAVSSYAVGPRCDAQLLAALANQTGGNLFVGGLPALADEKQDISEERARQENLRRGTEVGAMLANWTRAAVLWSNEVAWPAELGDVYPKSMPPLRSDRDTIVVGVTNKPFDAPLTLRLRVNGERGPIDLQWTAQSQAAAADNGPALAQIVELARRDGGITLPTVGSAGLAETGRLLRANVENLVDLAETSVAIGDLGAAEVAAQAALQRDPGNTQAMIAQRAAARKRVNAIPVAQPAPAMAASGSNSNLSLVRVAQGQSPQPPQPPVLITDQTVPAEGSLTDRYAGQGGELLSTIEQKRRAYAQLLQQQVNVAILDARRIMMSEPDRAIQDLKLALQNIERSPELAADILVQLMNRLQAAIREAERTAAIKEERDAELQQQLAMGRERDLARQRLERDIEREKQLIDRVTSLVEQRLYEEAEDYAELAEEIHPEGVAPRVAVLSTRLMRQDYLAQLVRADRWRYWVETLYQVELSSVPFPDEPPITYPPPEFWRDLTVRRKEKYGSMDLKASGEAEQVIQSALSKPLSPRGLEYDGDALEEVVSELSAEYGIPIQIDTRALADAGLGPEETVTINLHGISLKSALNYMLKQHDLTYIVQDEVLLITTTTEAEEQLVVKVYPVADLVLPIQNNVGFGGGGFGGGGFGGGGFGGGGFGGGGFGGQGGFGGGGFGGQGGFGGGGFGGQGGFGGGGFFSVPDPVGAKPKPTAPTADLRLDRRPAGTAGPAKSKAADAPKAIPIDEAVSPGSFWDAHFAGRDADPAAVRETIRQLMGGRRYEHVMALIHAALRHGQAQPWMYESLGIAMELAGRPPSDIERAVMSAVDFSTSTEELMYIAQYLCRIGIPSRGMKLYQQVAKLEPLRGEAYALGLRAAQQANDLAGVEWATVGALSQAWPADQAEIEKTAVRVARATLEELDRSGKHAERDAYLARLQLAIVRDVAVRVSWTGSADVDISVEEPAGTVCSLSEPRTIAGGVNLGDSYLAESASNGSAAETYVCAQAFAGTYRVRIQRIWGEIAADKVTVDVVQHLRSGEMKRERRQVALADGAATVVFDLDKGRRTEPLEAAQLAGAVQRQQEVSRAVLAQQISSGSDESVLPSRFFTTAGQRLAALGRGGAVGFMPIVQQLPSGTMLTATGVVSADRRYVRITAQPSFTTVGNVQTFTFAGPGEPVDMGGMMPPPDDMEEPMGPFNLGGGGFGGR